MKKLLIIFCLLLIQNVTAEEVTVQKPTPNPLTVSQNIMFENCTKIFGINQEKLFYLTLASISANRFNIDEIQSANGYIIFSANRNPFPALMFSFTLLYPGIIALQTSSIEHLFFGSASSIRSMICFHSAGILSETPAWHPSSTASCR